MKCKSCGYSAGFFNFKKGLCKSCQQQKTPKPQQRDDLKGFREELNGKVAAEMVTLKGYVRKAVSQIQLRHPDVATALLLHIEGSYNHPKANALKDFLLQMHDAGLPPEQGGRKLLEALDDDMANRGYS